MTMFRRADDIVTQLAQENASLRVENNALRDALDPFVRLAEEAMARGYADDFAAEWRIKTGDLKRLFDV